MSRPSWFFMPPWLRSPPVAGIVALLSVCAGTASAIRLRWLCDDAFISFRYAQNLVEGRGLVFNAGERVEGYTNLLWTLWIAAGMALGIEPELWAIFWCLVLSAGTLVLLAHRALRAGAVPIAAAVAAAHLDWAIYATSGLETALFTFLALAGCLLLSSGSLQPRRLAAAGALLGLCALTWPDGILFAGAGGLVLLGTRPAALARLVPYGAAFLLVWVPVTIVRVLYYGDFFPNTYYAKSASLAWYSQGFFDLQQYFRKYWPLLLFVPLGLAAALRGRRPTRASVLAGLCALIYSFYIVRVGGDYMFARLLVPATVFYLLLLEHSVHALVPRPSLQAAAAAALAALVWVQPYPFEGVWGPRSVNNERLLYSPALMQAMRVHGDRLRHFFDGLDVRLAFLGSEAGIVYYSKVPVAIESHTGLTDRFVAHQPLVQRGRVGHEKHAPVSYLVDVRRAHFAFQARAARILGLDEHLPVVHVRLGRLRGRVLHWDPALVDALRRRGAAFDDFPTMLDLYLRRMPELPDAEVLAEYRKLRRFYFAHVADPERERPFLLRLGHAGR
jgi:arabinofuranosyltransferase